MCSQHAKKSDTWFTVQTWFTIIKCLQSLLFHHKTKSLHEHIHVDDDDDDNSCFCSICLWKLLVSFKEQPGVGVGGWGGGSNKRKSNNISLYVYHAFQSPRTAQIIQRLSAFQQPIRYVNSAVSTVINTGWKIVHSQVGPFLDEFCGPCSSILGGFLWVQWNLLCSPSPGGNVTIYVWHKPAERARSFLFCSCVCFCLCGPFNCISFRKFSQQLSIFSLCSSDLISALLVLSNIYIYIERERDL